MAASRPFRVIASNVIPGFQEIQFHDETFEHIVEGHPEFQLPSLYAAIEQAVSNSTTSVHLSKTNSRSLVFVDENTTRYEGDPLRVPVKNVGNNTGIITSAYFASSTPGVEIWRKK